jgi:phosphoenolpyruvate synthase/pyruvate phosphate dikinase
MRHTTVGSAVREMAEPRKTIHGIPGSPGRRLGRARVCRGVDGFAAVIAGEILVTRFTSPELVLVFDRIAGFVTDQGGSSAHAAVVAREVGIPGVVGTQKATELIVDGDSVVLDGTAGRIYVDSEGS